jgi:hypothetical protein
MFDGQHLWYALPSGRVLCYPFAKLEPDGVTYAKAAWKPAADAKEWPRARLWKGLACENITQATANDLLRHSLRQLDDVVLHVKGMPAKSHASQGECRTLALALRLGIHRLVTEVVGTAPLLVLDDVLSELDPYRCEALLRNMPEGQVVITTAAVLPESAHPNSIIHIANGVVVSKDTTNE